MEWDGRDARWAGPGARWHQRTVEGARLRWVECGAGAPLLLLHGYGGGARWWTRNVAALAVDRRVRAMDLPGFGGSRSRQAFSMLGVVDLLVAWLKEEGLPPSSLVAHSMGGQVALLLAARHPHLVDAMVLAAPAGLPFTVPLPALAWRAFRSRQSGDARFTPIVVAGSLRAGPRVMWQAMAQIRAVDVRPYLPAVRAPTLILWGARDRLLPVGNGPILAPALSNARLEVVPGAGHNLMFEQAAFFNEAVRDFLATATPAVGAE